jgi:sec-independent protein translocase protein TatB
MFDIGWSELVVIGIVALIAIGPKELPGVLRGLGHWMGKVRRMAAEFQDQFREAMREAEVADLKKQFDDMQATASNVATGFDNPLDTARREMEKAFEDKPLAAPMRPQQSPRPRRRATSRPRRCRSASLPTRASLRRQRPPTPSARGAARHEWAHRQG